MTTRVLSADEQDDMDRDLIEPGDSGGGLASQRLQCGGEDSDREKCTPYASASSMATPTVKTTLLAETPPPSPTLPRPEEVDDECEKIVSPSPAASPAPWTSPAERAAVAMSRRRTMTRMKASVPYVVLSGLQTAVGAVIVAVGGAAFATTPTFNAGCFWAGLVILTLSIYSFILLGLKLTLQKKKSFKKCKRVMYHALVVMCVLCILTTIPAAIMDMLAAYMLHQTEFSRCLHTGDTDLAVDCDSTTCPYLHLPPNTCYCCYLYHHRKARGCHTPFLLDKPTYYEGVESCSVLSDRLNPMLTIVGLLCIVSTALNIIFLFKNRPVRYYVKNEKGKEEEVEEEEGEGEESEGEEEERGLLRKVSSGGKVRRDNGDKRADIIYTAANMEETIN